MFKIAPAVLLVLLAIPSAVPAAEPDDLKQSIDALNETQKAILRELQEIKRVLQQQQPQARPAADLLPSAPLDVSGNPWKGSAGAKVAILEFSEFQCPFCARYFRDTYPQLLKDYVDTGRVKYVWLDLPLDNHKNAQKAAEAAQCADEQQRFWEMHDRLFANQKEIDPPSLTKHAEALGLDTAKFQQCLDSGRAAAGISKDAVHARSAGLTGTPSFLVGVVQPNGSVQVVRKLVGAKPLAEFRAALDALLTPAAPPPTP